MHKKVILLILLIFNINSLATPRRSIKRTSCYTNDSFNKNLARVYINESNKMWIKRKPILANRLYKKAKNSCLDFKVKIATTKYNNTKEREKTIKFINKLKKDEITLNKNYEAIARLQVSIDSLGMRKRIPLIEENRIKNTIYSDLMNLKDLSASLEKERESLVSENEKLRELLNINDTKSEILLFFDIKFDTDKIKINSRSKKRIRDCMKKIGETVSIVIHSFMENNTITDLRINTLEELLTRRGIDNKNISVIKSEKALESKENITLYFIRNK